MESLALVKYHCPACHFIREIFDEKIWNASESFHKAQAKMQSETAELEAQAQELEVRGFTERFGESV